MQIDVKLHGILRDQIPAAKKGNAQIKLLAGDTVADLLSQLKISRRVDIAINEEIETNENHILVEGDQVHLFTAIGGG